MHVNIFLNRGLINVGRVVTVVSALTNCLSLCSAQRSISQYSLKETLVTTRCITVGSAIGRGRRLRTGWAPAISYKDHLSGRIWKMLTFFINLGLIGVIFLAATGNYESLKKQNKTKKTFCFSGDCCCDSECLSIIASFLKSLHFNQVFSWDLGKAARCDIPTSTAVCYFSVCKFWAGTGCEVTVCELQE